MLYFVFKYGIKLLWGNNWIKWIIVDWMRWILVDLSGFKNLFDRFIVIMFLYYCLCCLFVVNFISLGLFNGLVFKFDNKVL